ncbi:hypothetical protein OG788_46220 [Streptomyces sp. NBC_00647]|uniref:hypothetical protein n=1 Tax=Streptomyces sp. NBC_00647 TaxID=2975796 RepID=UPI00324F2C34
MISNVPHFAEYFGVLFDGDCWNGGAGAPGCDYGTQFDNWAAKNGYDVSGDAYQVPTFLAAVFAHRPSGTRPKNYNLPGWKKVKIGTPHIIANHAAGGVGYRQNVRDVERKGGTRFKDKYHDDMSPAQIESTIRQAYRYAGPALKGQRERVRMRGVSNGLTIEMWFNRDLDLIETAYPVGRG